MNRWRARIALFAVVSITTLSGSAALGPALAQAQPFTGSAISSPQNGAILYYNGDQGAGSTTVQGTVTPAEPGFGDLLCYTSSTTPIVVSDGIAVTMSGSFAETINLSALHGQACVLRFVPAGMTPTPTVAAASFQGPEISVSDQYSYATNGALYGYDVLGGSLAFTYELGSLGECPVRASYSTDPASLASFYLFDGNACLLGASGIDPDEGTRSAVQIDGVNAYSPGTLHTLTTIAGFVPLRYQTSWSDGNAGVSITETDSLMLCSPTLGYPPTATTCPSLVPSGVLVQQTTTLAPSGQATYVTQRFIDTDGIRHVLDLLFSQSVRSPTSGEVPGFEFPRQSVFSSYQLPGGFALFRPGPNTIYVIASSTNGPGYANPIGAITYGAPPQTANFVTASGSQVATFLMHYSTELPADGSRTYTWAFAQAADPASLTRLVTSARDRYVSPRITVESPLRYAILTHSPIRVSGVASDTFGIGSVLVAGRQARLESGGRFEATVDLRRGLNRLTVRATNLGGVTRQVNLTVRYAPARCVVPALRGRTLPQAIRALNRHNCTVGPIRLRRSRTIAQGHILTTHPRAGRRRPNGTPVTVILSAGRH